MGGAAEPRGHRHVGRNCNATYLAIAKNEQPSSAFRDFWSHTFSAYFASFTRRISRDDNMIDTDVDFRACWPMREAQDTLRWAIIAMTDGMMA